jgi:hypothetical protein
VDLFIKKCHLQLTFMKSIGVVMQLKRLMPWKHEGSERADLEAVPGLEEKNEVVSDLNVPNENPLDRPVGLVGIRSNDSPKGPMASLPVSQFFSQNFINRGRYTGSIQKSQDSLEQGLEAVIAQFQNTISIVMDEVQAKIDTLRKLEIQSDGVSGPYSGQLKVVCERLERDLSTLNEQLELSKERKGWVLAALNEYRIGFDRGLREAIDAELLGL